MHTTYSRNEKIFIGIIISYLDLTLKALSTIAADDILIFYYFAKKIRLAISCELAEDLHEMPNCIFSESNKNQF